MLKQHSAIGPRTGQDTSVEFTRQTEHPELWMAYHADPNNPDLRNELAMKYERWVWKLAHRFKHIHSSRRSVEEHFSDGFMGLLKAMPKWRMDGGASFLSYSHYAIWRSMGKGSILCYRNTAMSQTDYHRVAKARRLESHRLGHRVNDAEVARSLKISENVLSRRLARVRASRPDSSDINWTGGVSRLPDPSYAAELNDSVLSIMQHVPESVRDLLWSSLAEQVTLRDLAEDYDCSPGAIRKRLKTIIDRAMKRSWLSDQVPTPTPDSDVQPDYRMSYPIRQLLQQNDPTQLELRSISARRRKLVREEAFFAKCASRADLNTPQGQSIATALEEIRADLAAIDQSLELMPAA